MKKQLQSIQKPVWKGSVILISYFLFAACMQHDESLSPRILDIQSLDVNSEMAGGEGIMTKRTFTAHLNAENETGPVESLAQGQAIFRLSADGTQLYYKLIVANIENITMAHIHCGVVDQNGPFFVWLFPRNNAGVTLNGTLMEGVITDAEVLDSPCAGVSTVTDLVNLIQAGGAYVNVHTLQYGGGEIRGQIK